MASEASRSLVACSSPPAATACDDAVGQVLVEQAEGHGLERLRRGGDLGEDVDAVRVLGHHPLDAADLALDAAQALEVGFLGVGVPGAGHAGDDTPQGYHWQASGVAAPAASPVGEVTPR